MKNTIEKLRGLPILAQAVIGLIGLPFVCIAVALAIPLGLGYLVFDTVVNPSYNPRPKR